MFASLPGVSAPPPFGGNQRTVVVRIDPDRLRAYQMSPDEVIAALNSGNTISPSGNVRIGKMMPIVPINALVRQVQELGTIPIRPGQDPTVYLRDVATILDASDIPTGYALVNGRRAVYILVTKRADASTLSVVNNVKKAVPSMQAVLPDDIKVGFEFDQSPTVTRAMWSVAAEGLMGAVLTGLMVLLFLRDWRSVIVVVLNIPFALCGALMALWATGQTINIMTLGRSRTCHRHPGRRVHGRSREHPPPDGGDVLGRSRRAAWQPADGDPAAPRDALRAGGLHPVVLHAGGGPGAVRPALARRRLRDGGLVLAVQHVRAGPLHLAAAPPSPPPSRAGSTVARRSSAAGTPTAGPWAVVVRWRWLVVPAYLAVTLGVIVVVGRSLGLEIFPKVDAGRFQLRMRAPTARGTRRPRSWPSQALETIEKEVGRDKVAITIGYVGLIPSSYPINAIYQWTGGPEEAILRVALKEGAKVDIERLKEQLRRELAKQMPDVRLSFEPADIVSEVMSFGSPTPVEVAVTGPSLADDRAFAEKAPSRARRDPVAPRPPVRPVARLPDHQHRRGPRARRAQRRDGRRTWPARWSPPRRPAASSCRTTGPTRRPASATRCRSRSPTRCMDSLESVETVPIQKPGLDRQLLLRDVAQVRPGTMPGEYDRYNMKRTVSLTANIAGEDLGRVAEPGRAGDRTGGHAAQGRDRRRARPDPAHGGDPERPGHRPGDVHRRHPAAR